MRLKVKRDADGEEMLPVLWEDNYFALLPGQSRQVTATYAPERAKVAVDVSGWNVKQAN